MLIQKLIFAFFVTVISCSANSASFDCSQASRKIEVIICSDSRISELDEMLGYIYTEALKRDVSVRASQREWIKGRNACDDDRSCIIDAYEKRIQEVQVFLLALDRSVEKNDIGGLPEHMNETRLQYEDDVRKNELLPRETEPLPTRSAEIVTDSEGHGSGFVSLHELTGGAQNKFSDSDNDTPNPNIKMGSLVEEPILKYEPALEERGKTSDSSSSSEKMSNDEALFTLLIIAAPIIILFIWVINGYRRKCPSCERWFAGKRLSKDLLDVQNRFKTVTRHDKQKDREGKLIKVVERQEQVAYQVSTFLETYRCKHCQWEWARTSQSQNG